MAKKQKIIKQETTSQRLSGIVKSCRNIMRKDKGLNGDADRLPMLTWIMFLKFLDDNELILETNAGLDNKIIKPSIDPPYRWRDWAKNRTFSGDDLINFINNEECSLPDGRKAPGLFKYLRSLQSETGKERKDVIGRVFTGINNRMINGYLLREVINKIDEIHFTNNEELNTLSHLYESLLKEMRDASGDAGEFYTPRPVIKFMVEMINPKLGETVLDPAAGTGGFLVESFEHLKKQAKKVEQHQILQEKSIIGGEAKPLPYLLSQMNLLLHGLEYPNISPKNSLDVKITELSDDDKVDIIITNPPFGGEEQNSILNNFPSDLQTTETAMLFLQLIMRKLKDQKPGQKGGKAAIVVPNGTLFALGIAGKIKEELLKKFNLHTIVRLREGVFAPYTDIPTNLLFFEKGKPTKKIWFYELPPPEGRKKYSKTKPMQFDEFNILKNWWKDRVENDNAWIYDFGESLVDAIAKAEPYKAESKKCKNDIDELKIELSKLKSDLKSNGKNGNRDIQKNIDQVNGKINLLENQNKAALQKYDEIVYAVYDLDIKNPNRKSEFEYKEPKELICSILVKEQKILEYLHKIQDELNK